MTLRSWTGSTARAGSPGVGTRWTYPPTAPDMTTVIHFYQQLAWDGKWHLDGCPSGHVVLCANKDIDETKFSFTLWPRVDENGQPGYTAELAYPELRDVCLDPPWPGHLILDVVHDNIAYVEVLYRSPLC
jgi:hypothetical protein